MCREHGSVRVVRPPRLPGPVIERRRGYAVHRVGRPPRLLRGRDLGGRQGAARGEGGVAAGGAGVVRAESRLGRSGRARGDRQRARDRADHRAACRRGRARACAQGACDRGGESEDGHDRRLHAGRVARRRPRPACLDRWRADAALASARLAPAAAGQAVDQGEERDLGTCCCARCRGARRSRMCSARRDGAWLAALELGLDERETVDAGLRQLDFLQAELAHVDERSPSRRLGRSRSGG
jgi:hypothetical protein